MYHLQVLTPESVIYDGQVVSLIAPGEEGYLGVLSNHAPLITSLLGGTLLITKEDRNRIAFKISPGFLKVCRNKAVVVVEAAEGESMSEADIQSLL